MEKKSNNIRNCTQVHILNGKYLFPEVYSKGEELIIYFIPVLGYLKADVLINIRFIGLCIQDMLWTENALY